MEYLSIPKSCTFRSSLTIALNPSQMIFQSINGSKMRRPFYSACVSAPRQYTRNDYTDTPCIYSIAGVCYLQGHFSELSIFAKWHSSWVASLALLRLPGIAVISHSVQFRGLRTSFHKWRCHEYGSISRHLRFYTRSSHLNWGSSPTFCPRRATKV
jgi:hypothetical protein